MEKNNQCLGSSSYIHSNFCKSPCFLHLEIVRHGTHIDFRLVKQFCNFPLSVLRESVQRLISKQETKKITKPVWLRNLDFGLRTTLKLLGKVLCNTEVISKRHRKQSRRKKKICVPWRKISTFSDLMLVEINFWQPKKGTLFRTWHHEPRR